MALARDIWRPLIVDAPIDRIIRAGGVDGLPWRWLATDGYMRFSADPFGLARDGRACVFLEGYDYRTRRGVIEGLLLDDAGGVAERRTVLEEPWHLSYPFVFAAEGEVWMLPEACRSGRLTLYRAVDFPWRWERAHEIGIGRVAIDATPLFHDGLWWLFHAADDGQGRTGALFLSWAERLSGPWRDHPANPVRLGRDASRPGGTPVRVDGVLTLPMQDCTRTYGGGVRPLRVHALTTGRFVAEAGDALRFPAGCAPFTQGLHTLSAMGERTLVDVKRWLLSPRSLAVLALRGPRQG